MKYAVGFGPLKDNTVKNRIRKALNKTKVMTARELSAKKEPQDLGVTAPIVVTADPAWLLEPEPFPEDMLRREGIEENKRLIGISFHEPGSAAPNIDPIVYHSLVANARDFVINRLGAKIIFLPMRARISKA
jgi:polysaccharide pyruvyl transferase WcaK-like protein